MATAWTKTVTLTPGGPGHVIGGMTVRLAAGADGPVRLVLSAGEPATGHAAPFRRRYRRPAGCTDEQEAAVLDLAAAWSRRVTRITVLNQARFAAVHARLADGYRMEACLEAIAAYGRDEWHRQNGAWLDLADFFKPRKLDVWIRKADGPREAARRRDERRPPADPAARRLVGGVAEARAIRSQESELVERFGSLAEDERRRLIGQAMDELTRVGRMWRGALRPTIECFPVRKQVCAILLRGDRSEP